MTDTTNEDIIKGIFDESTKNHGPCDYCGEDIITNTYNLMTLAQLKIDNETKGKWHTRCYYQAMLNLLLTQKKS